MLSSGNLLGGLLAGIQSIGTSFSTIKTFLFIILVLAIVVFIITTLSFLMLNNIKKSGINRNSYLAKSNYNRRKVLYK